MTNKFQPGNIVADILNGQVGMVAIYSEPGRPIIAFPHCAQLRTCSDQEFRRASRKLKPLKWNSNEWDLEDDFE